MPATIPEKSAVFLHDIADLEHKIAALKQRHDQAQTNNADWTELRERQQVVQSRGKSMALQQELQEIANLEQVLTEQLLTILEELLENQQFSGGWQNLFQDLFWNAVRFGGAGLLLGWSLKSWLS